jgi:hypothetical protein
MSVKDEIIFLFIGGPHQVAHLAPVAAELSRLRPDLTVTCLYWGDATAEMLTMIRESYGGAPLYIERISLPLPVRPLTGLLRRRSLLKGPLLWQVARRASKAMAIVTPERTSAALRYLGLHNHLMIHFRHGAGDRAPSSERRLRAFDVIVVPGEKDRERAHFVQQIPLERIQVAGYVKLDWLARQAAEGEPLFSSGRPAVVYNPHFDGSISSWPDAQKVLAAFAGQDRYDLIFAPHIRLTEDMGQAERTQWQSFAVPGKIIVDLGSNRLLDMTYTRAADIYLGDMSSQLYEFLIRPRPAAFLNSHGVVWQGNPRYAGWRLGEVAGSAVELFDAIDRAVIRQPERVELQNDAVARAFGDYAGAARCGAAIIGETIDAPKLPRIRRIAVS